VTDAYPIFDVNVKVKLSHKSDDQLDVYLVAPNGTRVELFTDVGGSGDNFTDTILDGEAATSIIFGSAPFAGTFRPEGNLAVLDNKSASGTWTLEVSDDTKGQAGKILGWSLTITGPTSLTTLAAFNLTSGGGNDFFAAEGTQLSTASLANGSEGTASLDLLAMSTETSGTYLAGNSTKRENNSDPHVRSLPTAAIDLALVDFENDWSDLLMFVA
jgi:subtilisin-like proprotein convertase family protein